jgi:hypothetical protein
MDSVILAHGSGVDDLIVFASTGVVVLAVRQVLLRRRVPEDPRSTAMTEPHPGEAGNDDEERDGLGDPAASHGSDLDPRTGADDDRPEPAGGVAQPVTENR